MPAKRAAIALMLFIGVLSPGFGADSDSTPKSIPELQAAIERILKETKTPGAGIAIVSRDKAEWIAGCRQS